MPSRHISRLAIPAVSALIVFLAYTSQYLFLNIEPSPLGTEQLVKFNALIACIWICYARACVTDPGQVPRDWQPSSVSDGQGKSWRGSDASRDLISRQRWCRRCEAFKAPRAHHCQTCQRCIPKMDHHCPWTANCVSHFTFPHFIRFVFYAVVSMVYLEYFLYIRVAAIWKSRHMPSYYGPSLAQLGHLFLLVFANSMVLLVLVILLVRTLWMLGGNTTTIEGWEISRHQTLLRRARVFGGYLDGPDGIKVRIQKQEFPYDIGVWQNIRAGMGGSANVLGWFWPLSATPHRSTGLEFKVNGFEDSGLPWPPPDPDRMYRQVQHKETGRAFTFDHHYDSNREEIEAFKKRQQEDLHRRQVSSGFHRRRPFRERYVQNVEMVEDLIYSSGSEHGSSSYSGEEGWRNAEGDRLRDFGVDEDVEFYDEDDIPLATLIRQRKQRAQAQPPSMDP